MAQITNANRESGRQRSQEDWRRSLRSIGRCRKIRRSGILRDLARRLYSFTDTLWASPDNGLTVRFALSMMD